MRRCVPVVGLCALLLSMLAAPGCSRNPVTGDRSLMFLSPKEEVALGQEAKPEFVKEFGGPYGDPVIQQYVQNIGQRVAAAALEASHDYPYSFTVLDSEIVNAFALPGGPICVTRGLLWKLQDESELAGILAHEAVHVAAQHSNQQISRQMSASVLISVVGAAASRSGSSAAGIGTDLAKVVAGLSSLKYSRDHETEADLYGVRFLIDAGYQPMGLVRVMEMFERLEQEQGSGGPEFLRTHPNPDNRAENLRNLIYEEFPDAPDNPSLIVGREAYRQNVLSRQDLVERYATPESDE